jgi:hypothetical protein
MFGWVTLTSAVMAAGDGVVDENGRAPSKELLLYLAEFEDREGQWIDPMSVATTDDAPTSALEPSEKPLDSPVLDAKSAQEPPQ